MHELAVTRVIDAAPSKVWQVMTERANEWWCPKPWRAEVDFGGRKAGSATRTVMYGPDGELNEHPGFLIAWDEGRRFAFTDAIEGDLVPAGPFMIGIFEIAPEGDGTRYTARARHWSDETRKEHEAMGFVEGWQACADQLAEICESEN